MTNDIQLFPLETSLTDIRLRTVSAALPLTSDILLSSLEPNLTDIRLIAVGTGYSGGSASFVGILYRWTGAAWVKAKLWGWNGAAWTPWPMWIRTAGGWGLVNTGG